MAREDLSTLPADLPVPVDDGAALHLPGQRLPALRLASTAGRQVQLDALGAGVDCALLLSPHGASR